MAALCWTMATSVLISLVLTSCNFLPDSDVSHIYFDDARYRGGPSRGFDIAPADLTPVGQATRISADVEGETVHALRNVDPHFVVVMPSATQESPYWIFFRDGAVPNETSFAEAVPGLCAYLEETQPPCSS